MAVQACTRSAWSILCLVPRLLHLPLRQSMSGSQARQAAHLGQTRWRCHTPGASFGCGRALCLVPCTHTQASRGTTATVSSQTVAASGEDYTCCWNRVCGQGAVPPRAGREGGRGWATGTLRHANLLPGLPWPARLAPPLKNDVLICVWVGGQACPVSCRHPPSVTVGFVL